MNNITPELLQDGKGKDESTSPGLGEDFLTVLRKARLYQSLLMGVLCACIAAAIIFRGILNPAGPTVDQEGQGDAIEAPPSVNSSHELMTHLKQHHLWEIKDDQQIPPVVLANYPPDIDQLEVNTKKRAFLHALLPMALLALAEIKEERESLEAVLAKFPEGKQVVFDEGEWRHLLSQDEIQFIGRLTDKYRSYKARDLLARVDTFPVSLIMAQAALESSWGASRFAEQGNNIFGLWTWGEKGLIPGNRDKGEKHKIAVYHTVLDSVRAYILTLNRLPAYRQLRSLRRKSRDPLVLADGLKHYSQRGAGYVRELKTIIRYNELMKYDHYNLAEKVPNQTMATFKLSKLM